MHFKKIFKSVQCSQSCLLYIFYIYTHTQTHTPTYTQHVHAVLLAQPPFPHAKVNSQCNPFTRYMLRTRNNERKKCTPVASIIRQFHSTHICCHIKTENSISLERTGCNWWHLPELDLCKYSSFYHRHPIPAP